MGRKISITKHIGDTKLMADVYYDGNKVCSSLYFPEVIDETDNISIDDLAEFLSNVKYVKEDFQIDRMLRNILFNDG